MILNRWERAPPRLCAKVTPAASGRAVRRLREGVTLRRCGGVLLKTWEIPVLRPCARLILNLWEIVRQRLCARVTQNHCEVEITTTFQTHLPGLNSPWQGIWINYGKSWLQHRSGASIGISVSLRHDRPRNAVRISAARLFDHVTTNFRPLIFRLQDLKTERGSPLVHYDGSFDLWLYTSGRKTKRPKDIVLGCRATDIRISCHTPQTSDFWPLTSTSEIRLQISGFRLKILKLQDCKTAKLCYEDPYCRATDIRISCHTPHTSDFWPLTSYFRNKTSDFRL